MNTDTTKPIWWNNTTKDILEILLTEVRYKYAKKGYHNKKSYNIYYGDVCLSFDIEDTSFYDEDGFKVSTMYVWQFGINGLVIMGRTWKEFIKLIDVLKNEVRSLRDENNDYRLLIFVHFLSHEFQFIRKLFKWDSVFSSETRQPIYALTDGIEFRDSYILTNKSLQKVADDLRETNLKKMVGDLDYTKMRGCKTPLSDKEIGYCMADVQILNELIREKIEDENGNIGKIPLTNTGYVRRYVRRKCIPTTKKDRDKNIEYFNLIHCLNLQVDEYIMLQRAFQGGFTHANSIYVDKVLAGEIHSIDFTSSYPAQMLSKYYPMSTGREIKITSQEQLDEYLKDYLSIFTIKFYNIRVKDNIYDGCISMSKCCNVSHEVLNNGRVMEAFELTTTITNVDLKCIKKFYDYDRFNIGKMYIYDKGYLPKPIIESVLDLYKAKTELKGVKGSEVEYMIKKSMLNSIYGMMVTSPIKELIECNENGEWIESEVLSKEEFNKKLQENIEKYNNNKRRFLFYPWGVFITSWAREALFTGILSFGKDYIYSDTDSIKCFNIERHMDYINKYNDYIINSIDDCLKYYGLDTELSRPKNKRGEVKQIGVWDIETTGNPYTRFKTLGAKRYMYEQSGDLHITIAGVSKKLGKEYIESQGNPFNFFKEGMIIDDKHSGKLTHTYLDYEQMGTLRDYLGNEMEYHELSSVHLESSSYEMSLAQEFKDFLENKRSEVIYG